MPVGVSMGKRRDRVNQIIETLCLTLSKAQRLGFPLLGKSLLLARKSGQRPSPDQQQSDPAVTHRGTLGNGQPTVG
jgi:hypothetical protein